MKTKNIEVTNRYLNLLKDIYKLTNNMGFRKINLKELIRKHHLANSSLTCVKKFLVSENNNDTFYRWAKIDVEPTINDAFELHESHTNNYRNYIQKRKMDKLNALFSISKIKPVKQITEKRPLQSFTIESLIEEIKLRGYSGSITKSITI